MAARLAQADLPRRPSVGACWADLGQRLIELMAWRKALPHVVVPEATLETLRSTLAEGRGLIAATGHLGHWELMAGALARCDLPVHSTAARRRTSPLHRWLDDTRAAMGVTTHHPGGGAREVRRALDAGAAVGVFVDQRTGERGVTLPFLGRPAHTPITCGRLVARRRCPLCLVWSARHGRGYRVEALRLPVEADGEPLSPEAITARLTDEIARLIQARPTEWVWIHDRWGG